MEVNKGHEQDDHGTNFITRKGYLAYLEQSAIRKPISTVMFEEMALLKVYIAQFHFFLIL